jgi:renal tumor antigen
LTSGGYGPEVDEWAVGCMLYELLTTKPLFPGKHELDQITRIHTVLGTPSRDLLQHFKQNPNQQMSYAFAPRACQDLRKVLPGTSSSTLQLLAGLLTYNPQQRLSAADALNFPCFAPMRDADAAWEVSGKRLPFPSFYFQHPLSSNEPETRPGEVIPAVSDLGVRDQPDAVGAIAEPIDTKIRIRAYHEALHMKKPKHPMPFNGHAFQFAAATRHIVYQKPRPELVQARLARLVL